MTRVSGGYVIALFLMYWCTALDATKLKCYGVEPLPLTNQLKQELNNSIFWTKLVAAPDLYSKDPPIGFVREYDLVRTNLTFIGDKLYSYSYAGNSNGKTYVDYYEIQYKVDDKLAILESSSNVKEKSIVKIGDQMFVPKITFIKRITASRFALIHVGSAGAFRIYIACDRSILWVQISDMALNYDLMEGFSPVDRFSDEILSVVIKLGISPTSLNYLPVDYFPFDINSCN